MENIDISVIIPAFNVEKYIGVMIEAILNQTFKNFELIIVDDCSKDNTVQVVNQYQDKRIKLIKRDCNSGCCFIPRADAVKVANGEWIVYLDADDFIEEKYLEELYTRVNEYNVDICSPQMIGVSENMELKGWKVPEDDFKFNKVWTNVEAFNLTVPKWEIGMNGPIIKKSVYLAAVSKFDNEKIKLTRSDEILSRLLLLEANGYISSRTKYYYRDNPVSITKQFNLKYLEWMDINSYFMEFVGNRFGLDSQEYRNVQAHDFYSYYSTLFIFTKQVKDKSVLIEGLERLKEWYERLEWGYIIKEVSEKREKVRILLCKNFKLSIKLMFVRWKRYKYYKTMKIDNII